jgi:hypothetical protein
MPSSSSATISSEVAIGRLMKRVEKPMVRRGSAGWREAVAGHRIHCESVIPAKAGIQLSA